MRLGRKVGGPLAWIAGAIVTAICLKIDHHTAKAILSSLLWGGFTAIVLPGVAE